MQKKYNIAVIGATGNVGREVLMILDEKDFPIESIHAVASDSSIGKEVSFGEEKLLNVCALETFDFNPIDIAFFCTNSKVSQQYIPKAIDCGVNVIDKSSYYRMHDGIPLVIPEINGAIVDKNITGQIISNPNCVAIPLSMALFPLHTYQPIKRVVVSTYQSVSGAGRKAMDELFNQTKSIFMHSDIKTNIFSKQIAFNIIPQIDELNASGYTSEEEKVMKEVAKIVSENITITATCVRVPVFIGHCISVNVEFFDDFHHIKEIQEMYKNVDGIRIIKGEKDQDTSPIDIVGEDTVNISRLRIDPNYPNIIDFWVTCDNLRKGAALNAIQIAEHLISS